MLKWLAKIAFRLFGWETDGTLPPDIKKGVIIFAPHTSNWDFVIGRLTLLIAKIPLKVLIKKELFVFPNNLILNALGAIPVARGKKNYMIEHALELLEESGSIFILITPEGSRKLVKQWKKGFYLLAIEAKVPIILSFIDYVDKTGGIGPIFYPSGDYNKDMEFIYKFYSTKRAKYPEKFYLPLELDNV
jgi:1-acyl-sn-glycerol-3-phosphate acyltransferase